MFSAGLEELKVFVELASIYAGEGDVDIDKVNRLQSATSGYAPLIFIDKKQTLDAKTLIKKCQQVWQNLSTNEELANKLVSVNNTFLQPLYKTNSIQV